MGTVLGRQRNGGGGRRAAKGSGGPQTEGVGDGGHGGTAAGGGGGGGVGDGGGGGGGTRQRLQRSSNRHSKRATTTGLGGGSEWGRARRGNPRGAREGRARGPLTQLETPPRAPSPPPPHGLHRGPGAWPDGGPSNLARYGCGGGCDGACWKGRGWVRGCAGVSSRRKATTASQRRNLQIYRGWRKSAEEPRRHAASPAGLLEYFFLTRLGVNPPPRTPTRAAEAAVQYCTAPGRTGKGKKYP